MLKYNHNQLNKKDPLVSKQKGFAHAALIIGLIVALVGALGFVYWKNAQSSDGEVTNQAPQSTDETPELLTASIDDTFARKISVDYPETWTLESSGGGPKTEDETATQTLTLLSPTKRYEVELQVGANGGLGGTCDPSTTPIKVQYMQHKEMHDFPEGLFAEVITKTQDIYSYSVGVYRNIDEVQNAQVGDPGCFASMANIITLSPEQNLTLVYAKIKLKQIEQQSEYGYLEQTSNMKLITDEFATSEYKDAVEILRSMKVT